MRATLLATSMLIGLTAAQPGWTQSAERSLPPAGTTGETAAVDLVQADGLTDIIVTAQRRSENLQKAAIPVDVVTGDTLANSRREQA